MPSSKPVEKIGGGKIVPCNLTIWVLAPIWIQKCAVSFTAHFSLWRGKLWLLWQMPTAKPASMEQEIVCWLEMKSGDKKAEQKCRKL